MKSLSFSMLYHPTIALNIQEYCGCRQAGQMHVVKSVASPQWDGLINDMANEAKFIGLNLNERLVVNEANEIQNSFPAILPYNYVEFVHDSESDFDLQLINSMNGTRRMHIQDHTESDLPDLLEASNIPTLRLTCKCSIINEPIIITISVTKPYLNIALGSNGYIYPENTGYLAVFREFIIRIGQHCDNARDFLTNQVHTVYNCRIRAMNADREARSLEPKVCVYESCIQMMAPMQRMYNPERGKDLTHFPWVESMLLAALQQAMAKAFIACSSHDLPRHALGAGNAHLTGAHAITKYTQRYLSHKKNFLKSTQPYSSTIQHWPCLYAVCAPISYRDAPNITSSFV